MSAIEELLKFEERINKLRDQIRGIEEERVQWSLENRKKIKDEMPKKGGIYKIKDIKKHFSISYYGINEDDVYYLKVTHNRFTPKSDYCFIGDGYPKVHGDVLDSNFSITDYHSKNFSISDIEEIDQRELESEREKVTNVYVMIDRNTGYYKIGRSVNPTRREKTLQSEKPTIDLMFSYQCRKKEEKVLHDMFKESRVRGEWFDLKGSEIARIHEHFSNASSNP